MKISNKPYLKDIVDAINSIEMYLSDGITEEEFISGKGLYQDAVVRNIEIIGEAANKLSKDFIQIHHEIPWKNIIGMRNKVIHEYAHVDWDQVWLVATQDIKELLPKLESILENLDE